jgi:hypothetical protein
MRPQVGLFGLNSTKLYKYFYFSARGLQPSSRTKGIFIATWRSFFTIRLCRQPDKYSNNLVHKRTRYFSYQLIRKEPDIWKAYLRTMTCFHGTSKNIETEYEYSLQITWQQGHYHMKLHKKQILMEVDFSFILLLALGAVINLHVKI